MGLWTTNIQTGNFLTKRDRRRQSIKKIKRKDKK